MLLTKAQVGLKSAGRALVMLAFAIPALLGWLAVSGYVNPDKVTKWQSLAEIIIGILVSAGVKGGVAANQAKSVTVADGGAS